MADFEALGAVVLGVSPDSPQSHRDFIAKNGLKTTLLSDAGHKVMDEYGVWQLKKLYGKESWGVVRSTFLVDPAGNLAAEWRAVKVDGHADEVKQKLLNHRRPI